MIIRHLLKLITLTIMLVLMGKYIQLNSYKFEQLGVARDLIAEGPAAQVVSIKMGQELVYSGRLANSEVHDHRGQKQISFLSLPDKLLATARSTGKRLIVSLGDESAPALLIGERDMLTAEFSDRLVRLYDKSDPHTLMNSILQDQDY